VIDVTALSKRFGDHPVLDHVDLHVARGEVVAVVGPSGCGKTTLLRILAGLERPDAGEVHIDGTRVASADTHTPPEARQVGLVFQDFALFPHLRVDANIAFGLKHLPRAERDARVTQALRRLDLAKLGSRHTHELSGGQQQRVALARAIAREPRVLLMDEPFSSLDMALRRRLRVELRETLADIGIATVFVTHDQHEALSLADRVAVMAKGRIAQCDRPEVVYRRPASVAVAHATGQASVLPGRARAGTVETALGTFRGAGPDGEVDVILRPEDLVLAESGFEARVTGSDYTGPEVELWLEAPPHQLVMRLGARGGVRPGRGERLTVTIPGEVAWVAQTRGGPHLA
jgi:iron(III) transport system ATP-binding protein